MPEDTDVAKNANDITGQRERVMTEHSENADDTTSSGSSSSSSTESPSPAPKPS